MEEEVRVDPEMDFSGSNNGESSDYEELITAGEANHAQIKLSSTGKIDLNDNAFAHEGEGDDQID